MAIEQEQPIEPWRACLRGSRWMLAPAVQRYLEGKSLSAGDISLLRAYLKQWITKGNWKGDEELKELRTSVDMISTRADIEQWDALAEELGLDPW